MKSQPTIVGSQNTADKTPEGFWHFVCLMTLVFSLSPFAIDMYLPALPTMATYFDTNIDALEASVAIYLLLFALGQLVLGALADSIDKTKLMAAGLFVFAIASFGIGMSSELWQLYVWRAVQAFSGGSSVVVYALIQQKYGNERSNQVISYVMAAVVIAPMIAPMVGGIVLVNFGWQWIFYALAVYALVTLAMKQLAPKGLLPKTNAKSNSLNLGSLLQGYRAIFSNKIILAYILSGGFSFAGLFAFVSGSPFVYIEYFGVAPEHYGLLVALNALAMVSMNVVNAKFLSRFTPTSRLIFGGLGLGVIAVYLLLVAFLELPLPMVVIGVVAYMGMLGLTAANAISASLARAEQYAGVLSGINGVMQFGLGALASAVISIVASNSVLPMNATMAACGLMAMLSVLTLKHLLKKENQS